GPVFALSAAPTASAAPAAAATTDSASADDGQDDVSITLDEGTPGIEEKRTVTVRGLLANPTEKPIEQPWLDLELSTRTPDAGARSARPPGLRDDGTSTAPHGRRPRRPGS